MQRLRKRGRVRRGRKCLPCKLKINDKVAYNQPVITKYSWSFNKNS